MRGQTKTQEQLLEEVKELRQRVAQLEALEAEHKRAAEALRFAQFAIQQLEQEIAEWARTDERMYKTLVEASPDAVTTTDLEGRITYASRRTLALYGLESTEGLLGRSALELIAPEDRERATSSLEGVLEEGIRRDIEYTFLRADGTRFPAELSAALIRDASGNPAGFVTITRDITERKRAERLLRALNEAALAVERALTPEQVFAAVAEELKRLGFSCAVLLTDGSRSTLFPRYLSYEAGALRAVEKLTGLRREDFSVPVENVDAYRRVVWERKTVFVEDAEEPMRQVLRGRLRRFAGQVARMLKVPKSITAPLIVGDEVIGVLSVQSDDLRAEDIPSITAFAHQMAAAWRKANLLQDLRDSLEELKRTRAQFLQAQKMEAIGRLAGGVAHDFNNLLTAIMGFSQLLLGEMPPDDPRRLDAQEILNASERATSLTRHLLAFSRRQRLQVQVLDLNALVADTEKMLRRLIGEDIELVSMLDPMLQRVKGDPGQMDQVIMNLAVNARDAMPEGGRLTIRTENVTLGQEQFARRPQARPGDFVRLSVADTGVGMDEETLQHLFEPFFTTKGPERGTGLGLSVVYGIVAQHEGWVNVYSEPGQGSTFEVYLPGCSVEVDVETGEVVSEQGSRGHGQGVLLVEDDEAVRVYTARVLDEEGYVAFQAANAKQALEIFQSEGERIHLLFSDVVLPDGTGPQLADQLLSRNGDLQVLLGSGYTDDKSQLSAVLERGFRFVQKPYVLSELRQAIREAIEPKEMKGDSIKSAK